MSRQNNVFATYGEMHAPANKYLSLVTQKNWLKVHNNIIGANEKELTNAKNLQFAKDLFYSWDEDHDGNLTDREMVKPLVALGLAPDKKVARLICLALDPKGYLKTDGEPTLLTMDDFIKILK